MLVTQWWGLYHRDPFIRFGVKVIDPPSGEQVSLEEACAHLRVGFAVSAPPDDAALIEAQTSAAREWCEEYAGRAYARQMLELGMARFPGSYSFGQFSFGYQVHTFIELPNGPVRGVESVSYATTTNDYSTLDESNYLLDNYAEPARIYLAPGASWPSTAHIPNAVKVRYHAGYDGEADSPGDMPLPALVKQAILLMLGHFYENREDVFVSGTRAVALALPKGASSLLDLAGRLRTGIA